MRTLSKKPIQVYLDVDQEEALRALAQRLQISMAELIRRSVDQFLAELPVEDDPAMRLVGLGSGPSDLARDHDRYLIELETKEQWPERSS
ncbi:MAG TPA: CopG family transcriptional regulator [Caldilineae bacterium]|jgi:hypothetical protein|nr:CopG family transcriptional regulator [Caldilineae bacterium]